MSIRIAGEWFDLWHAHPNEDGVDQRWENLLGLWARIDMAGRLSGNSWQSWLVVEPADPREDAAYLHTPNPNRDNFPYPYEEVEWGADPPAWATPCAGLEFGRSRYHDTELLWVRRPQLTDSDGGPEPALEAPPDR